MSEIRRLLTARLLVTGLASVAFLGFGVAAAATLSDTGGPTPSTLRVTAASGNDDGATSSSPSSVADDSTSTSLAASPLTTSATTPGTTPSSQPGADDTLGVTPGSGPSTTDDSTPEGVPDSTPESTPSSVANDDPVIVAEPFTRTYQLVGGTVTVDFDGTRLALASVTPGVGFEPEVRHGAGREIDVRFESATHESRLKLEVEDGQVDERIEERAEG